tara:strand:+ start:342 stop:1250 length:909 start_codon:yes stop_codon:yes gene_type:complete
MSNPWAQSFEDLRSPYLQEKKAKKDYDGDGKIESGAKEYRGVVHNKIQKAKGGKADGQDTSSVKEHHQKDADGNPIEHGDGTPASVDEAKIDKIDPKNKRKRRNEVSFGKQTKPYDPPTKAYKNVMGKFLQKQRKERHDKMRGTTYKRPKSSDSKYEEFVLEADKKGKGSGSKDACYHKVKSRYSVWPSAYASGALVKCRKVGAKNWGNSSKKEEFDYYQMPMKSFEQMVGECWKTHEQRGMKKKGNRMVPNCVPKGSPRKEEVAYEAVKNPKLDIKETGVKNKIEINPEIKTEAAKAPEKK